MDIKTKFINGYLKETIYVVQLEGFVVKVQNKKFCNLKSSTYGLKQESRSWNMMRIFASV